MVVTEDQAEEMRDAILLLEENEAKQNEIQHKSGIIGATSWFNTLGINIQGAQDRTAALDNFDQIKSLFETERNKQLKDGFKIIVLNDRLNEANEKFKEIKRND